MHISVTPRLFRGMEKGHHRAMEFKGKAGRPGVLANQFLVAMPGMQDPRFARAVIYVCAHSEEGAMGFIINQEQQTSFSDILVQLGIIDEDAAIRLPDPARGIRVRNGGPVDRSRGFVLHSADFRVQSSVDLTPGLCLTATVDILRAMLTGDGPARAIMALGYSGWGAGQLETEISENAWLTFPALPDLIFDGDMDSKYDRILTRFGVNPAFLSPAAGHA